MKTLLLSACVLFSFASPAEDVGTHYEEGQRILVTSSSTSTTRLESTTLFFDGTEMPSEQPDKEDRVETRTMEFSDRVLATDDGRRTVVERAFGSIEKEARNSDGDSSSTGVLAERTIRIEENADGEISATIADDEDDVDAEFLAGFTLTFEEELLLPAGEVEPGDTWTLEGEAARRYFGLVDSVTWFEEEETDAEGTPDFQALFAEELAGEVEVKFMGQDEQVGQDVWAFEFELEMQATLEELTPEDVGMPADEENPFSSGAVGLEAEVIGRGRFWVARASHLLVASEGEGDVQLDLSLTATPGDHELSMELAISVQLEGKTTYALE